MGYVIQEDFSGKIWAGTTDGLYCFDKKTNRLERFTMADGLPSNVICGLSEDFQHDIWISTYRTILPLPSGTERMLPVMRLV